MSAIKHIWFDFSDTIGRIDRSIYNDILYATYGKAVGKEVSDALIAEYKEAFTTHKSNSAVFTSLGLPSSHLANAISVIDPKKLYSLTDAAIPEVLPQLQEIVPISIFSNNKMEVILPSLGLQLEWFTHILGPDDVKSPKPALEGFYKMIELSNVEPSELLYIGDDINKDLAPAKEAGITTGLLWTETPEANYCFKSFQEILELAQS